MTNFDSFCIIDDDEFFVYNAKRILKESEICKNVLSYADGQKAIDGFIGMMVEGVKLPPIVLLDINMPNKDGWEFLEEYIDLPEYTRNNTQLYIISSFVSPENINRAKEFGIVNGYITKPLTIENLQKICLSHNSEDINYVSQENNRQEPFVDYL